MSRRFLVQIVQHDRRRLHDCLHIRVLTVENSERILRKAANTILIELIFHAREIVDQSIAIT